MSINILVGIIFYWWITILKRKLPSSIHSLTKSDWNFDRPKDSSQYIAKVGQPRRKSTSFKKISQLTSYDLSNIPSHQHKKFPKNILIIQSSPIKILTNQSKRNTSESTTRIQSTLQYPNSTEEVIMFTKKHRQTLRVRQVDLTCC